MAAKYNRFTVDYILVFACHIISTIVDHCLPGGGGGAENLLARDEKKNLSAINTYMYCKTVN